MIDSFCLTVGGLKKAMENLPDDMPVLYQRIEDVYFQKHGWSPKVLLWERHHVPAGYENELTTEEQANTEIIDGVLYMRDMSDYIAAFSAYKHPEEEVFVINAHY